MPQCLSVVIPCYNEAATLATAVARVLASPYTSQVVIVDDASTDDTLRIARAVEDPRVEVLTSPVNCGKGAAVRRGFAHCRAPFVIVQDADLEYDPQDFEAVLAPLLADKADVVFGSRFHNAKPHRVLYFWHALGNRVLTAGSNMFTNLNLSDMETCYKAFRLEVVQSLDLEEERFGFEPEITAKVAQGGWRIYEVGISYSGRTYAEGKKIGWRDGLRALYCVVRYSPVGERLRRMPESRAGERAAAFAEADEELAGVLHSLEGASNYTGWIHDLVRPFVGSRVLEVGAGHGDLTERLAADGHSVLATDLSKRCTDRLRSRFADEPRVQVGQGDLEAVAGADEFDTAVLVNVLEHIEEDDKALRRLAATVRPGGHVVVFVPAFESLYSDFDRRIGHVRRYRRRQLRAKMVAAGLEVVDLRYVNSAGALAWWLVAKRLGQVPTAGGAVKVYDRGVVPLLRRLEARWRPPIGQSLFCAARRPDTSFPAGGHRAAY
ncbi:MAG: glycosyltransferase [Acidimicrobiales bacterium]